MNIIQTLEQHPKKVFWISCVLLGITQYFFGLQHFYFDAERYWESGREMVVDGTFSIYNHVTQRGVLFPLINYGIITILGYLDWHEISVFKYLNTVFVCWGLWFVIPAFYAKATGTQFKVWQRLVLVLVVHFFWFRYISCPLSDFLCIILILQGFNLLWGEKVSFLKVLLVGIICGFVFNTRPIYNLLLAVYPLFFLIVSNQRIWLRMLYSLVLVAVAFIINIPQLWVNEKVWKVSTFFQPTDAYYEGRNLYLIQLKWGLYIQKYETFVGDTLQYKKIPVIYFHNKELAEAERIETEQLETFEKYFQFMQEHPQKLLRFFKNFFNGLDLKYNTPYIYDIRTSIVFSLLNYSLWFLGWLVLIFSVKYRKIRAPLYLVFAYMAFTCLLCIPIAMEPRFLLSLYLMMYVLVVAHLEKMVALWREWSVTKRMGVVLAGAGFITGCFMLSHQTYSQMEYPIMY